MPRAAIVYHSRTGTTQTMAEQIAAFLDSRGVQARLFEVWECNDDSLSDVDYVLLGCWTHGLFFVLQHPDEIWVEFARKLPTLGTRRVGLFATYKLATGSMFRKMRQHLAGKVAKIELELKSRSGQLSRQQMDALEQFIA